MMRPAELLWGVWGALAGQRSEILWSPLDCCNFSVLWNHNRSISWKTRQRIITIFTWASILFKVIVPFKTINNTFAYYCRNSINITIKQKELMFCINTMKDNWKAILEMLKQLFFFYIQKTKGPWALMLC